MFFDYPAQDQANIDMADYTTKVIVESPFELSKSVPTPAAEDIFQFDDLSLLLDQERAEIFHTFVTKVLFACKSSSYDFQVAVVMLCTRVMNPTQENWKKLLRMLQWVKSSLKVVIILRANDLSVMKFLKWHVDAKFAVHPDSKSGTGKTMTYGAGVPIAMSYPTKLMVADFSTKPLKGEAFLKFKCSIMGID
jgi:hypothetical protein